MDGSEEFLLHARSMSQSGGACIMEFFRCPKCEHTQCAVHQFRREVPCGACGALMKSIVPQLPQPGEITKDCLMLSLRSVRDAYPVVGKATAEWMNKQEGFVKAMAASFACYEVRRALNKVESLARDISGGHR